MSWDLLTPADEIILAGSRRINALWIFISTLGGFTCPAANVSVIVRSGCSTAISNASIAPSERPQKCAAPISSRSRSARMPSAASASAKSSAPKLPFTRPGASTHQWCLRARGGKQLPVPFPCFHSSPIYWPTLLLNVSSSYSRRGYPRAVRLCLALCRGDWTHSSTSRIRPHPS